MERTIRRRLPQSQARFAWSQGYGPSHPARGRTAISAGSVRRAAAPRRCRASSGAPASPPARGPCSPRRSSCRARSSARWRPEPGAERRETQPCRPVRCLALAVLRARHERHHHLRRQAPSGSRRCRGRRSRWRCRICGRRSFSALRGCRRFSGAHRPRHYLANDRERLDRAGHDGSAASLRDDGVARLGAHHLIAIGQRDHELLGRPDCSGHADGQRREHNELRRHSIHMPLHLHRTHCSHSSLSYARRGALGGPARATRMSAILPSRSV